MLVDKEVHEVADDARHDGSGDELAESKQVER